MKTLILLSILLPSVCFSQHTDWKIEHTYTEALEHLRSIVDGTDPQVIASTSYMRRKNSSDRIKLSINSSKYLIEVNKNGIPKEYNPSKKDKVANDWLVFIYLKHPDTGEWQEVALKH